MWRFGNTVALPAQDVERRAAWDLQFEAHRCSAALPLHSTAAVLRNHFPTHDLRIAVVALYG
jgi:hypothetical protein